MRPISISSFLLFAIISATAVPAQEIDAVLARVQRRQVTLSTGGTTTTTSSSGGDDNGGSTTTTTESSVVTSQESAVVESTTTTVPASPSVTEQTSIFETTSTRQTTNSDGKTTQVPETFSSTSVSAYTYSYSQLITSATSQVVETYTQVEGGSTVTGTRTRNTVVPVTTSVRSTPTALADGGSGGGSSGLSSSTKNTIGGVVGGIGGALLIAGLAYTAWRIWGRKKNLHDDDLYDPNANTDKVSTSTDTNQTPFQSTLNQYHNPGPVNTASNF